MNEWVNEFIVQFKLMQFDMLSAQLSAHHRQNIILNILPINSNNDLFCSFRSGNLFLDNQCWGLLKAGQMRNSCGTEGSIGHGFESQPPHCRVQPWTSCLHIYASVTKQHTLEPANRWWCLAAGELTAGLAESNGSLLLGLWLRSPAGWLPRTRISSGTLHSFQVCD